MLFKNIKTAHEYYNYPSSYRFGTIHNNEFILRSYSNGENCDKILNNGNTIYYKIKTDLIKNYKNNIDNKVKIRFFKKQRNGVLDMNLYLPTKFYKGFVKLENVKNSRIRKYILSYIMIIIDDSKYIRWIW